MSMSNRPIYRCWWCQKEIHPLDDLHKLWCRGGAAILKPTEGTT